MRLTLSILLLLRIQCGSSWITSKIGCRRSSSYDVAKLVEHDPIASTSANLTIPRFFDGEIDEGIYPSSLHFVHVQPILSDDEVATCLELAKEYAASTGAWEQPDQERHETYSTCDFPVDQCERLSAYLTYIGFDDRIWNNLTNLYGVEYEALSYLDLFCASYQPGNETNPDVMDRLEMHRDGSLLSFTITLSAPDEFEGGGTLFDGFRDVEPSADGILVKGGCVRPLRAGDSVFHCGKMLHGAEVVSSGQRIVMVGFIDVANWYYRPGVLSSSCRQWGRMDVAKLRYERQEEKTKNGKNGWFLKNDRWIAGGEYNKSSGRSKVRGFCPAFASVERRADPEFQRLRKLEAEDLLLRSILLQDEDLLTGDMFEGDITIE